MKKIISLVLISLMVLFGFAGCNAKDQAEDGGMDMNMSPSEAEIGKIPEGVEYGDLIENEFIKTSDEPVSTFSADVDTASYAYFRKLVNSGYVLDELIATGGKSIRTEEMINYFDYDYQGPAKGELFGKNVQISACPWNGNAVLMMLGLKTEEAKINADNNLIFLIDVSGSMQSEDKLPLLKKAFGYLVSQLDDGDKISIVTYSGKEAVVLEGCRGSKKDMIMDAVNRLDAKGSTNGEAGLQKAYALAEKYYIAGGNNRIIMASDGDLNVGISSSEEIERYVSQKRDSGVYLSVLGFGTGNYKDSNMETLADNGNGVYYYIDGEVEAEKVFGSDIFSTLYTVGRDVKLQLTFNPENVESYRLVGYENRLLNKEDFADDTKDAGDVGAGHSVTVCYELILKEGAKERDSEWMTLAVRYKLPNEEKSELRKYKIGKGDYTDAPSNDFKFVSSVIEFSMLLHESKYLPEGSNIEGIINDLVKLGNASEDPEKKEFLVLLQTLRVAK